MGTTFFAAVFDTADAARTAAFWSAVLGRPVNPGATARDAAIDATAPELGPRLAFHRGSRGQDGQEPVPPDLITTDYEAETRRLGLTLGAKVCQRVDGRKHTVDHIRRPGRQRVRRHRRLSRQAEPAGEHGPVPAPRRGTGHPVSIDYDR